MRAPLRRCERRNAAPAPARCPELTGLSSRIGPPMRPTTRRSRPTPARAPLLRSAIDAAGARRSAPMASRIPISRVLPPARTINIPATLEQAINSSSATAPESRPSKPLTSARSSGYIPTPAATPTVRLPLESGYASASCAAMVFISASACRRPAPGFKRPNRNSQPALRFSRMPADSRGHVRGWVRSGTQRSNGWENTVPRNPFSATPTMVNGFPFSVDPGPHRAGASAEPSLPQAVADHGRSVVRLHQQPSSRGLHSQHVEVVARDFIRRPCAPVCRRS